MSLGSAMCGGMRGVDCPMYDDLFNTLVGCVFQWGGLCELFVYGKGGVWEVVEF